MTVGVILLLATGCGTLTGPRPPNRSLPPSDVAQSQAWAHYAHGLLLEAEKGRGTSAALQSFEAARANDPNSRQPTEAVALNLLQQNQNEAALAVLADRCHRQPDVLNAHLTLARTAELTGSYLLAAEHYAAAFSLQPEALPLAFSRIRCLFAARHDREAVRILQRLYARQPGDEIRLAPIQWAAYFLHHEKTPRRAIPCLELAADWATNNSSRAAYLAILADTTATIGNSNAARRIFQHALAADNRCIPALQGAGTLLAAQNNTNAITQMIARAPQRADPLPDFLVAAYAYEALGVRTQAVAVLTTACNTLQYRQLPIPEMLFMHLGATLDEIGRDEEAATVFQKALAAVPQAHAIMNYLAYMWAVNNTHLEEAASLAQDALTQAPDNAAYLDTFGWVRYRQGRYAEALTFLLQALKIIGDDPIILDHVGDTLNALERTPEALAYWSRSFELDSDQPDLTVKLRRHGINPAMLLQLKVQPRTEDQQTK